jgi:hypothetical protein
LSKFSVLPYTEENLLKAFVQGADSVAEEETTSALHRRYFLEYFQELKAAAIVLEPGYIDRDYLEDYAAYYARCFREYHRKTLRLHFFSSAFDQEYFQKVLQGEISSETLSESYLGFIVIKPLPRKIIGRTCLKTYAADGRRNYPILRDYSVNLFGLELKVKSLAYQEQDTVVAACATSALWACFQGTGILFQHKIPSPVELTGWAGEHLPENLLAASARTFPNAGLTPPQMAHAVRRIGLEPLVTGGAEVSRYAVNSTMYAYLSGKIPSVLGVSVYTQRDGKQKPYGRHAVAMTGYSLDMKGEPVPGENGFLLRANRIDRIYAHDDQVGPFARMEWNGDVLKTSWGSAYIVTPDVLLFPLYHKIRIPFSLLEEAISQLDARLETLRKSRRKAEINRAEWDIFLTTVCDYKASVRNDKEYEDASAILPSLTVDLPRFIWRVMLRVDDELQFDFLFDATGVKEHNLLVHAIQARKSCSHAIILSLAACADNRNLPRQAQAILACFQQR